MRQGLRNVAAEFEEADARADALSGNCQTVRRLGRPALALAMCGDAARAEKLAAETSKLFPNGTSGMRCNFPRFAQRSRSIAINRRRAWNCWHPPRLTSALTSRRCTCAAWRTCVCSKGAEAAAEFRKIVDHKGANWASTWRHPYWGQFYSLSYLGLARGLALAGDTANGQEGVPGLLRTVEGRRPGPPDPSASQGGIREAAVTEEWRAPAASPHFDGWSLSRRCAHAQHVYHEPTGTCTSASS